MNFNGFGVLMWQQIASRGLLALSALLACFLVYTLWARMDRPRPAADTPSGILGGADAGIDHFTFRQTKAGSVQWEVQAARARVVESQHKAELEQVRVTLFGEKGWELKAQGDQGAVDTATKDFVLTNRDRPIDIELRGGYHIYTNRLVWTDQRREVSTTDPVRVTGDGVELTGRGLVAKLDIEEFRILDDVRLEIVR